MYLSAAAALSRLKAIKINGTESASPMDTELSAYLMCV